MKPAVQSYQQIRCLADVATGSSSDAVIWYCEGRVVFCNRTAAQLLGYSEDEIAGREIESIDASVVQIPHPDEGRVEITTEYRHRRGHAIAVSVMLSSFQHPEGLVTCTNARQIQAEPPELTLRECALQSPDIYQAIVDTSFNAIVLSENGVIKDVNDELLRLGDFQRSDVVGAHLSSLLDSESAERVMQHVQSRKEVVHEITGYNNAGERVDAEVVGRTVELHGRVLRISAIREISQRKQVERDLLDSQRQLAQALEGGRMATFEWVFKTGGGRVSENLYRLFGHPPNSITPSYDAFLHHVHGADRRRLQRVFGIALTTQRTASQEIRVVWPNGEIHWLEIRGQFAYDQNGRPVRLNGVMVDIDEKMETERRLSESESHLAIALDAGNMGTFRWNERRDTLFLSLEARYLLGVSDSPARSDTPVSASLKTLAKRLHHDDRRSVFAAIRQARIGSGRLRSEFRIRGADERFRWVEVRGRFLKLRRQTHQITGVFTDITDRKRSEQNLHEAESRLQSLDRQLAHMNRLSSVGEMASTIAHEINQPLFVVSTTATLLEHHLQNIKAFDEDVSHFLNVMMEQAVLAGETMRRMRGFCLNKTTTPRPADMSQVIDESLKLLSNEMRRSNVAAESDLRQNAVLLVDATQIQQVLVNLIRNSIDAMSVCKQGHKQLSIVTQNADNGAFLVTVSDNGPGIPPDRRATIFEPFESTKADGMGMGLAISRSIIEAHGGSLTLDETTDAGASFQIRLPNSKTPDGAT